MSTNALAISNCILDEADKQGVPVSPMQLQKLLYFVNGWYTETTNGEVLFSDGFEAWQFGPVLPVAYHEFKRYGSSPISGRAMNPFSDKPWSIDLPERQKNLISEVVSLYGNLSGPQMSHLTHQSGTPWDKAWKNGVGKGDKISPEDILAEFKSIRQRAAA